MPLGLYTACQVSRALRPVLDRRHHRPARRARPSSSTRAACRRRCLVRARPSSSTSSRTTPRSSSAEIEAIEFSMELSSEVPGTNTDWPSDISLWVNDVLIGTWTSPGDFGDQRGIYTPRWWKLEGSQYGKLTTWRITDARLLRRRRQGLRRDARRARPRRATTRSGCGSASTRTPSIRAASTSSARGFGNYDQDILMRICLRRPAA